MTLNDAAAGVLAPLKQVYSRGW